MLRPLARSGAAPARRASCSLDRYQRDGFGASSRTPSLDQRPRDCEQRGRVAFVEREGRRIDQHQVIVRDFDVDGADAGPRLRAGVAAVRQQHVGRERRLVRGVALGGAELAGQPALVRQRALEVLAGHALDEAGAGEQLFERGLSSVCRDEAASAADGSANGTRKWRRRSCMMVRIVWQTARVIGPADGPFASGGRFSTVRAGGRHRAAVRPRAPPRRNQQKGFA